MQNPFRVGSTFTLSVPPCVMIIFGSTGDLTKRKLMPALYNIAVDGLLPANFSLVAFGRRTWNHDILRNEVSNSVREFSRRQPIDENILSEFVSHSYYCQGEFDNLDSYERLRELLDSIDRQTGHAVNRIFYLATLPEHFEMIINNLGAVGLSEKAQDPRRESRIIIEKPFGHDLVSARELNRNMLKVLDEQQIYRIDHYLGKETVQNLLVFRFANGIFEPIWNHKYIDHVEISVCESLGLGSRAAYFDKSGIVRDIIQNHLLQLLCLVALEPPVTFAANAVRDEKVKVLRSLRKIDAENISSSVIRGQYTKGYVAGEEVVGYLNEEKIDSRSRTETYAAMEVFIDNWRWAGVPFYLRAGKRLAKRITEITISFRQVPHKLFATEDVREVRPNTLSFQIQPDEGISLSINSKPPGSRVRVQPVKMDFSYGTSFGTEAPEAYERLILDCMRGDATLFTRNDEIEEAWDFIDSIVNCWAQNPEISLCNYEAGSWGPTEGEDLLKKRIGYGWRRL
ncbi:MAG: glucose-6-phosphate dehydrogenase [Deltaproteobacteria bacterium]|nr:glucose-6-phosphate dehydrogenase [Deltaproteobacteria bacterium]